MNEEQVQLFAERLGRAMDHVEADLKEIRALLLHQGALTEQRLALLEKLCADHEVRLRTVQTGVTQFKVWSGLTSGSSELFSLVALLRTFFE